MEAPAGFSIPDCEICSDTSWCQNNRLVRTRFPGLGVRPSYEYTYCLGCSTLIALEGPIETDECKACRQPSSAHTERIDVLGCMLIVKKVEEWE